MILEYGVKNFLSFKDGGVVSFRLDGNVPNTISAGKDFSTILCVKGANGSGKTHLLKGVAFLASFITSSFSYDINGDIPIDPFGGSEDFSSFYVDFRLNQIDYRYELDAYQKKVVRETFFRKRGRRTKLFERLGDVVVDAVGEFKLLMGIKNRRNVSVFSMANQHEIEATKEIYNYFSSVIFNVHAGGVLDSSFGDIGVVSKYLFDNPSALKLVGDFLMNCDTGVSEVKVVSEESADGKKKNFYPLFLHKSDGEEIWVRLSTESSGTKQIFKQIMAYFSTVAQGGFLVIDEFDLYLHPDILPKILNLFTDLDFNMSDAQMIFTSHQNDVMDICGKYRICLVSKEDNASFVYRLDEIPGDMLRNDRPISKFYKEGRIGGVPKI